MWKDTLIELGKISAKSKHKIDFVYEGNLELNRTAFGARDILVSCGCTTPVVNGNTITINFEAPEIPKHLVKLGVKEWAIRKNINVGYKVNGIIERTLLEFTAIIK